MRSLITYIGLAILFLACTNNDTTEMEASSDKIKFLTVDPGHFHAALVQKSMYEDVDSVVNIYAPAGNDLQLHLNRMNAFNTRDSDPTGWQMKVYEGQDFFEKMIEEKKGNVVVLAGNNKKKTEYIMEAINAGLHVYADKPMVINAQDFDLLKNAFAKAAEKDLVLYDIMTERFEITTLMQKELSLIPEIFGKLESGTPDNPAVVKESVHHFFKYVSGNVNIRPPWFFDVEQEGEGIVDVTTHLVDLVQWECFPNQVLDYTRDVEMLSSERWPTKLTLSDFQKVTGTNEFADYLEKDVENDTILNVFSNGAFTYKLKDIHARVSVIWAYQAPEGAGDTHYSIMRGTKANLVIRQGEEQNFKPKLYIEPVIEDESFEEQLTASFETLEARYPGISLTPTKDGWEVTIPQEYHNGHEAHFTQVTEKFIEYYNNGNMPEWEVPNMITKYYTTTKALEMASQN